MATILFSPTQFTDQGAAEVELYAAAYGERLHAVPQLFHCPPPKGLAKANWYWTITNPTIGSKRNNDQQANFLNEAAHSVT